MAYSRTSGRLSEAEKARFARRKGHPGGVRSEAQKQGLTDSLPPVEPDFEAALRSFILGDVEALRAALGLEVWENTPLHRHRGDRCDYCRCPVDAAAGLGLAGCVNNHEMWQLRLRLIAEIEARGGFTFVDLVHEDEARAGRAWDALGIVAAQLGVNSGIWDCFREAAGWEKTEQEGSDGGA